MKINHLELHCSHLEEQRHFYTHNFEFVQVASGADFFTLQMGSSRLTFVEDRLIKPYYHFALNIPPHCAEAALEWAQKKVEILTGNDDEIVKFSKWKAQSIYFLDPAGNVVELIARERFGQETGTFREESSILNISEVGLPVFAVNAAFKSLHKETTTPKFDCRDSVFCAAGNDEGLFIIVDKAEKAWFPTQDAAKEFPLKVEFEEDGEPFELETGDGVFSVSRKIKRLKKVG